MFSDVFIRRPILATVCSLIIILAGAICIPLLPIARYPELTPLLVLEDCMYVMPSTPFTTCSMGVVTALSTACALAPV